MRARILITLFLVFLGACPATAEVELRVDSGFQWLRGMNSSTTLRLVDERAQPVGGRSATISIDGEWYDALGSLEGRVLEFADDGTCMLADVEVRSGSGAFVLELDDGTRLAASTRPVHQAWPLLPALLAIAIALTLRQVLLALSLGVFAGAWIFTGGPLDAFQMALQDIVVPAVSDPFRAAILLFTGALGGMVAVMARAGGTRGLVESVRHYIRDARSAQFATAVLGVMIFFDDYANTLLVGNTMRPVTDRMRVSREKLSYIVDSTAAPIATVAWLSTWVGYQVGLIGDGLQVIGKGEVSAYATFLSSVAYSSYSWLAMALVFGLVLMRRDYGPMLHAERRARSTGKVLDDYARPLLDDAGLQGSHDPGVYRASLAVMPVLGVLLSTVFALWSSGRASLLAELGPAGLAEKGLRDIFSAADPASSLLMAVTVGSLIGIGLDTVGDWALRRGLPYTTYRDLAEKPEVAELMQGVVDQTNEKFARVENIRKFALLPKELDHEDGELTATQKLKRSAMTDTFGDLVEEMY